MSGSPLVTYDRSRGVRMLAGADETGRAPLAGPVVAAAVLVDLDRLKTGRGADLFEEMRVSKRIKSPTKRAQARRGRPRARGGRRGRRDPCGRDQPDRHRRGEP